MCDFNCFDCTFNDCVLNDDEIGVYTRYEEKYGHEMAAMITKKYIEYKEKHYAENREKSS